MMDGLLGVIRTLILSLALGSTIANRSDQEIPSIGGERETTSGGVSPDDSAGYCSTDDCRTVSQCSWSPAENPHQLLYSLTELISSPSSLHYVVTLPSPRGAHITLSLCSGRLVKCGNEHIQGSCITVPGIKPTVAGKTISVQSLEVGMASSGFQLILDNGATCEVTNKPRRTVLMFPCDPNKEVSPSDFAPLKAYEGDKKLICNYFVDFPPSQYGCPVFLKDSNIIIEAVSGCINSSPTKTTSNCHYNGGQTLSLIGLGFHTLCPQYSTISAQQSATINTDRLQLTPQTLSDCTHHLKSTYNILIGDTTHCTDPILVSPYVINCSLAGGRGEGLDVKLAVKDCQRSSSRYCGGSSGIVAVLSGGVSYREAVNFKDKFSRFVELGVGGLKKEIEELYRRAFASRDVSPDLLAQLGITHIKGILLYGPPGAGKTLLARTVAHLLGSKQVQLINGPEIVSKFLGESERNLRYYFQEAADAYKTHGDASELYVIIIDEIEAICKPRGKIDQSSAGAAYDSVVNQLLTLLDGLSQSSNVLVIGMTNRKELMDPALLRPGRFEVQIEVGLPDEEGREEIFSIHTREMRESGILSTDVNLKELAANTTRFSGAEIAGVVRGAASYALERKYADAKEPMIVTRKDFVDSLISISPAYTQSESRIVSQYLPTNYFSLTTDHESIITSLLELSSSIQSQTAAPSKMITSLIYGPKGTGKTTLAARVAVLGHFTYIKVVTASNMIGLTDFGKIEYIHQVFKDAFSSSHSLIVLDDVHRLVEYVQVGDRVSVSHSLMHALSTLLSYSMSMFYSDGDWYNDCLTKRITCTTNQSQFPYSIHVAPLHSTDEFN
uniref:Vesicle-fusing ATPase n=1 Tax=Amphimedon queenslandica TaxID=400682 RepID=A0A1X7VB22_AMPQE